MAAFEDLRTEVRTWLDDFPDVETAGVKEGNMYNVVLVNVSLNKRSDGLVDTYMALTRRIGQVRERWDQPGQPRIYVETTFVEVS